MKNSTLWSKIIANASLKFVSLIIAIVLWFVVLGSRNVEVTKEVPLEVVTPTDLVVANEVPDKVAFRLSGPKAFLRNILNRREPAIRVNLSSAKPGLVTYRFFSDNIQVPIGVKVLLINPTAIVVKLEPSRTKEVPVRLVTTGEAAPGFRVSRLELLKPTVRVRGAESKIESTTEVATQPLDLSKLRDTGEKEVSIDTTHNEGITLEGEQPRVHFDVIHETANFKIRNAIIKVLTDKKFKITPKEVSLYVRCNPDDLKSLERSRVYAVADLKGKGPGVYDISLTAQVPGNIKLVKILPAKAKITLY